MCPRPRLVTKPLAALESVRIFRVNLGQMKMIVRTCRCCVAAVWLHHSSNPLMEWSLVWQQSTFVWDLQWIWISCSSTVPAGDIPCCPLCGVCGDPSHMVVDFRSQEWNWHKMSRDESSPQEVRHTWLSRPLVSLVHCTGGVTFPSQFQTRDHNRGCFAHFGTQKTWLGIQKNFFWDAKNFFGMQNFFLGDAEFFG